MPAKLERCVDRLLKSKSFMPKTDSKKRKSSAYAICTASTKNKADVAGIIASLPPYVEVDFSEDGELVFSETEGFDFAKYDESEDHCGGGCQDCGNCSAEIPESNIYFADEKTDDTKDVFTSFAPVTLSDKSGAEKVTRKGPDGKDREYMNVPIEMLREGTFRHPLFGDLEINRKMMLALVQNFTNDILERELALDVSHEPDNGAYGWLRDLKLKRREFGNGKGKRNVLVGTFDLNARGEEMIREEVFKYFSIEYHRNYSEREKTAEEIAEDKKRSPEEKMKRQWEGEDRGKEYGPTIFGGALTNRPFIPSMEAVRMSEDVPADVAAPTVATSEPQKTTDEDGDVEAKTEKEQGGVGNEEKKKNGKKADGCKSEDENEDESSEESKGKSKDKSKCSEDEERDNNEEIKNAAAEKKARPPESKLPDAAFALVKRDRSGKIMKRSLPHHGPGVKSSSENSSVDKGRLRNALARWNQVEGYSAEEKARARRHLETHAKALLPSKKTRASEGATMFDDRIAELKDQLAGIEDQNSDLANAIRDQLSFMEQAKADHEAKLSEQASQAEKFETQLNEQKQLADNTAAQLAELKARDEAREAKLAEITEKNRKNEIEMYCEGLSNQNYPAAVVKAVKNVLTGEIQQHSEDDGDAIVRFSVKDGEKTSEHKFDLRGAIEYIVASIPDTGKVDTSVTVKHNAPDEPESSEVNEGEVALSDGTAVDAMDPAFIARSVKNAGHKTRDEQ